MKFTTLEFVELYNKLIAEGYYLNWHVGDTPEPLKLKKREKDDDDEMEFETGYYLEDDNGYITIDLDVRTIEMNKNGYINISDGLTFDIVKRWNPKA